MRNRIELAAYFADKGFTRGVEVGLCTGRYSRILLETIPNLRLVGIDPYHDYNTESISRDQNTNDANLSDARQLIGLYPNFVIAIAPSHSVAPFIADESLDFVFIDGRHAHEDVKQDIEDWYPKVRRGGILSGHDYYESKSGKLGIVKAVGEFVETNNLTLQTTEWDMEAFRDDRQPDWFIEKP